jgi:hypothetical protein
MATNLNVYANITAVDDTRLAQPGNYVQMDLANDKLIWSAGSAAVIDGADTPSNAELDEAATIIQASATEIDKLFLLDFSDTGLELKEIDLAGSTDTQYVICFEFDNATASIPTLEAYDDNTHTTANNNVLGLGTPASSMIKAVLTTSGTPGAAWTGTPIAGAVAPNVLDLSGAPLAVATDVYINIKVEIPASYATPFIETPVLTVRYTFS